MDMNVELNALTCAGLGIHHGMDDDSTSSTCVVSNLLVRVQQDETRNGASKKRNKNRDLIIYTECLL